MKLRKQKKAGPRAKSQPEAQGRQDHAPRAVLVLGMHRSGTSALTRVFSLLGADLPKNVMGPAPGNETGHWESGDIVPIHDDMLSSAGSRWDDWRQFNPDWLRSGVAEGYKKKLLAVLHNDFDGSALFVVKDPRICRFVPLWLELFQQLGAEPRVVIAIRNPLEVANSLKRRDHFSPAKSYLLWLRHALEAEQATRNLPRAIVSYGRLLDDWRSVVTAVDAKTGLRWPRRSDRAELEIDQFISDTLRHHTADFAQLTARADVADWIKEAYRLLSEMADGRETKDQFKQLDRIHAEFDKACATFGLVLESETEQFSKDLSQARGEAEQAEAAAAASLQQAAERATEAIKLKTELDGVAAVSSSREKEIVKLSGEVASRQTTIQQRDRDIARLSNDVDAARVLLRDSQTQVQHLAGELDGSRKSLEQANAERQRMAAALAEASKELDLARGRVGRLQDENKELRRNVNQLTVAFGEAAALGPKLDDARQAIERGDRRIDELSRELQAARDRVNGATAELARADSERDANRRQLSERDARAAGMERDLTISRALLDDLRATVNHQARLVEAASQPPQRQGLGRLGDLVKRLWPAKDHAKPARQWEYDAIRRSKAFDALWYLKRYPDVAASGQDPLWHYILHGAAEGRDPHPLFDQPWYRSQAADLAATNMTPFGHYVSLGVSKGLDPHPLFDTDWYLEQNPDVAAAHTNPLFHFMKYGVAEGRDPNPVFDSSWYLDKNPDVRAAKDNPLYHYVVHGFREGRDPHPDFNAGSYRDQNPDLAASGGDPLAHYLLSRRQNVTPTP